MKTLGQIAYEAAKVNQVSWDRVGDSRKSDWMEAAQAVRAAVIEECRQLVRNEALEEAAVMMEELDPHYAAPIRALKT